MVTCISHLRRRAQEKHGQRAAWVAHGEVSAAEGRAGRLLGLLGWLSEDLKRQGEDDYRSDNFISSFLK